MSPATSKAPPIGTSRTGQPGSPSCGAMAPSANPAGISKRAGPQQYPRPTRRADALLGFVRRERGRKRENDQREDDAVRVREPEDRVPQVVVQIGAELETVGRLDRQAEQRPRGERRPAEPAATADLVVHSPISSC